MSDHNDDRAPDSQLDVRREFYRALGNELRGASDGEPTNTGKGVGHFLGRALQFATSGRILNIVSPKKREMRR